MSSDMVPEDASAVEVDPEDAFNDWLNRSGDGCDLERAVLWQALALTRQDGPRGL